MIAEACLHARKSVRAFAGCRAGWFWKGQQTERKETTIPRVNHSLQILHQSYWSIKRAIPWTDTDSIRIKDGWDWRHHPLPKSRIFFNHLPQAAHSLLTVLSLQVTIDILHLWLHDLTFIGLWLEKHCHQSEEARNHLWSMLEGCREVSRRPNWCHQQQPLSRGFAWIIMHRWYKSEWWIGAQGARTSYHKVHWSAS